MAVAVRDGNFSDPTLWDTSAVPGVGEDAWANGFLVEINLDIEVATLRTDNSPAGNSGGRFNCTGRQVTAECRAGTSTCLSLFEGVLIGDTYGGTTSNARGAEIQNGSTQHGNSFGGSGSGADGSLVNTSSHQIGCLLYTSPSPRD